MRAAKLEDTTKQLKEKSRAVVHLQGKYDKVAA